TPETSAAPQIDLRAMLGRGTQATPTPAAARLQETAVAHPIVFTIEYALAQLLISYGIQPTAMMGYSLGEYVCACLAGVLSLQDALMLVGRRAQLIQTLPPGRMLAVSAKKTAVQPYLSANVALAAHNSIANCVLAGDPNAIAQVQADLEAAGIVCRLLETTHAFHSHMLQDLAPDMTRLAQECSHHPPQIPYISNVTGTWITAAEATDPSYWTRHMTQTVRCFDGLQVGLTAVNQHLFLEVGPGQSLGSFAKQHPACSRDQVALILSSLPYSYDNKPADTFLLEMVGKLWMLDHAPNWMRFHPENRQTLTLLPSFHQVESKSLPSASVRSKRGSRRRQRLQNRGR
ncbi:MAG: acyltransferase domain-containing protein, partial [Chloroflexi bacterium]|nr:acyltransferase domain-containing protein [Chloroflexota bacterium]